MTRIQVISLESRSLTVTCVVFFGVSLRYQSRPVPLVSVEEVNQWVENVTNGHISNFLESIPHDVVLMLMNAVYFKGEAVHQKGEKFILLYLQQSKLVM